MYSLTATLMLLEVCSSLHIGSTEKKPRVCSVRCCTPFHFLLHLPARVAEIPLGPWSICTALTSTTKQALHVEQSASFLRLLYTEACRPPESARFTLYARWSRCVLLSQQRAAQASQMEQWGRPLLLFATPLPALHAPRPSRQQTSAKCLAVWRSTKTRRSKPFSWDTRHTASPNILELEKLTDVLHIAKLADHQQQE